jgi:hypothetical protein
MFRKNVIYSTRRSSSLPRYYTKNLINSTEINLKSVKLKGGASSILFFYYLHNCELFCFYWKISLLSISHHLLGYFAIMADFMKPWRFPHNYAKNNGKVKWHRELSQPPSPMILQYSHRQWPSGCLAPSSNGPTSKSKLAQTMEDESQWNQVDPCHLHYAACNLPTG